MKRRGNGKANDHRSAALLLLSVSFLLGGVLGCLAEEALPADAYIQGFFRAAAQGTVQPALWRELWVVCRWPALALAAGALPLVGVTMPALFLIRGFFLSYGISALVTMGGAVGGLCSGVLFGPACVLTVPVLFVLGMEGLMRKVSDERPKGAFWRVAVSLPVLGVCVLLDQHVVPQLMTYILNAAAL